MRSETSEASKGVLLGLAAYTAWGCFPLYFALFEGIPAFEVLIHRIIWSCAFLVVVIAVLRRWGAVRTAIRDPANLPTVLGCALLISVNWGVYIYSVESQQVLQASLGYFLTPLVNVALGLFVLKERLARLQTVAISLAVIAILYQLLGLGFFPWISLALAFSFGIYGLLRKRMKLDGLSALFVETLLMLPLALLVLGWFEQQDQSHFGDALSLDLLLISSGVVTAIPLLLFAGAARRLRLATIGFLMYINPTMQFIWATWWFGEPLGDGKLLSFGLIWIALALYSWSTWRDYDSARRRPA